MSFLSGFVPSNGNTFKIIDNDATDAVVGTFARLAKGATFLVANTTFTISYHGGTGNDVVLTSGVNQEPTTLSLNISSIAENTAAATNIATLSTTDPDAGKTFSYTFVAGTGDADNDSFAIIGNQLKLAVSPDFETRSSYNVRVRSTDTGGLFTEQSFGITISDVNETKSYQGTAGNDDMRLPQRVNSAVLVSP